MTRVFGALALAFVLAACAGSSDPAAVIADARNLIASGKSGEAHVRLKKLLAQDAGNPTARVLLAQIALDNGDVRGADAELSALQPEQLTDPEAFALRAWVDLALGRNDQVLQALDSAGPTLAEAEAARLRASALRSKGAPADALPILRSAVEAHPDDGKLRVELAANLTAIGNFAQAERELSAYLEAHPKDADALVARGELRLRAGATARATEDMEAALANAPPAWPLMKRVGAELWLGDAAFAAGDLERARERASSLSARYPGALGTQLLVARVALADGRANEAADSLQKINDAMPGDPRVQALLIEAWLRTGNKARAIALLERGVQERPNDLQYRRVLAELMMQQNRPDRVVALLGDPQDAAVPNEADEDSLLSMARLAQERASAAIATLEEQLAKTPGDESIRVQLASAYLQNGQASRGLATLNAVKTTSEEALTARLSLNLALANEREVNKVVTTLLKSASSPTLLAASDAAQRAGRNDVAAPLVARALERGPKDPDALLRRANLDFLDTRYDEATAALNALIGVQPGNTRARIALARIAEAKGDTRAARGALQAALQADAAALEPALMLASLELRAAQPLAAAAVLDRAIAMAPTDGVAANAAGIVLLRARRYEEARARFGQATEQAAANARYRFNLGRAQFLAGDRAAAAQSFAHAVQLEPQWVDANIAAVRLALDLNRSGVAEAAARQMVEQLPKEPRSWLLLGDAQMVTRNPSEAAKSFAKAYTIRPSAPAAVREHVARRMSNAPRPEQPLLNWLAHDSTDLAVRRRLADFYQQSGAHAAARQQFELILAGAPNDAAALNNLAWLLAESDTQRAEALARRAIAIVPQQAAIADTLGWVLIKAGKYTEAAAILARAANDLPDDRSIRYHYALAAARAGDTDTARRELQHVLADGAAFEGREAAKQLSQELGS